MSRIYVGLLETATPNGASDLLNAFAQQGYRLVTPEAAAGNVSNPIEISLLSGIFYAFLLEHDPDNRYEVIAVPPESEPAEVLLQLNTLLQTHDFDTFANTFKIILSPPQEVVAALGSDAISQPPITFFWLRQQTKAALTGEQQQKMPFVLPEAYDEWSAYVSARQLHQQTSAPNPNPFWLEEKKEMLAKLNDRYGFTLEFLTRTVTEEEFRDLYNNQSR